MVLNGVNMQNLAILNGGEIHVVYKVSMEGKNQRKRLFYHSAKENALKTIISELTYDMGDLIELSYIKYDMQGNITDWLAIYKKGRCEE